MNEFPPFSFSIVKRWTRPEKARCFRAITPPPPLYSVKLFASPSQGTPPRVFQSASPFSFPWSAGKHGSIGFPPPFLFFFRQPLPRSKIEEVSFFSACSEMAPFFPPLRPALDAMDPIFPPLSSAQPRLT